MQSAHSIIRGGSIVAISCLVLACNSVVGIGGVALDPDAKASQAPVPDADRSACKLDARYPRITMTTLTRAADGSPEIFFAFDQNALLISLHNNKGQHLTLETFGTYQLTAADSKLETCGICALAGADFNTATNSFAQDYVASMRGQLQITTATTTQLIGSMQDLELRHVYLDTTMNTTTDANDGCTVAINEIDFNLAYSAGVAERSPAVHALLGRQGL